MVEAIAGIGGTALVAFAGWVAHLGSRVSVLESQISSIDKRLERIEEKLDVVISRR